MNDSVFQGKTWVDRLYCLEGSSEDDCKSCAKGFQFDEKEKVCLSLCPNGNYFDQNDDVSY